jgi:hypothetical protein
MGAKQTKPKLQAEVQPNISSSPISTTVETRTTNVENIVPTDITTSIISPKYTTEELVALVKQNPLADVSTYYQNPDFTTKAIDLLLHWRQDYNKDYKCSHFEHQMKVLNLLPEDIKQIFNDPSFFYAYRDSLKGKYGRLNSVLLSGYFNLYDELLRRGVEYDPDFTLKCIYNYLLHMDNTEDNKIKMPTQEFNALQRIISKVKKDYPNKSFFNLNWWEENKRDLLSYFMSYPSEQVKKSTGLGDDFEFDLWEYYPCYINNKSVNSRLIIGSREIFLNPMNIQNEDIDCDKSKCSTMGGRRKLRYRMTKKNKQLKKKKTKRVKH